MSITYDSTTIEDANIVTRRANHESTADFRIDAVKLTRRDGEIVIDSSLGSKIITVEGMLIGSSQSDLEDRIDSLKELCSRKDKNLDISYGSGTRRYVCRLAKVSFDRDHYNLTNVPFSIQFYVGAGIGKDTSETTAKNTSGITATQTDATVSFSGSYDPKPRHKITFTTRGNADVCKISNQNTGDYIEVDLDGFSNGDYLEVDEENQTVKKNGTTELEWRGKFPSVVIGNNSLRLEIFGSGYTLDQSQTLNVGGSRSVLYTNGSADPVEYQSFVPTRSGRRKKLGVGMSKETSGALGGNVLFSIHEDDNGQPGAQIGNGWQEAVSSVSTSTLATLDIINSGTLPFLVAGRRYWIRNQSINGITGDNASNFVGWHFTDDPTDYPNGKAMAQKNSGEPLYDAYGNSTIAAGITQDQVDFIFYDYAGDGASASHTLTWQIYYTKKYL